MESNYTYTHVQALPFSDALKLLAYLKDWTLNPDKVFERVLEML